MILYITNTEPKNVLLPSHPFLPQPSCLKLIQEKEKRCTKHLPFKKNEENKHKVVSSITYFEESI